MPSAYLPQLATLVKEPPEGDLWVHEIKYDGYRIGCDIRGARITLTTRNGNDWTATFPEVVEAIRALDLGGDALLDGEVAIVLKDGRTSFQALQNALTDPAKRASLVYFVFDVLRLGRERVDTLTLEQRKERLRTLLGSRSSGRIRYAAHVEGRGRAFFDQACQAGLEGIISKRRDLPHKSGRHGGWVKTKCVRRQEFVIGGFTEPEGMRAGIGALLVGYYEGAQLVFAGKVGTGFTHNFAVDLRTRLDSMTRATPPFTPAPPAAVARRAQWVKPTLVCEVEFTEWTEDGKARHPSFQGLRADKRAQDVIREREVPTATAEARKATKTVKKGTPRAKR